jgi:drug/metabolite transporter (DMT)-like permease
VKSNDARLCHDLHVRQGPKDSLATTGKPESRYSRRMSQKLSPVTALLLTVPPLMWAGNAVVGRMVHDLVPPITLNFLRWLVAFFILLPLAWQVLRPSSGLWSHWRRFGLLSLLGVGCYNALQYLALQTSTPLNVTLVAASGPFWMLIIGALFFKAPVRRMQLLGALLSISGALVVLSRGNWTELLAVRLVAGDLFILLATACWAFYSWLLSRRDEPDAIRNDWAAFLMGQVVFGLAWSGLFSGLEWTLTDAQITWGWPLIATLAFVAVGPAVLAYRCWGLGIQQAGPAMAGFFANLTPLFAAILSAAFLGELPHLYHVAAFGLIIGGIWVSSRRMST